MYKEFVLEGLNCADCSNKIEDEALRLNGIKNTSINFATQKLKIEFDEDVLDVGQLKSKIERIALSHEPQIKVVEQKTNDKSSVNKKDLFIIILSAVLFLCGYILSDSKMASQVLFILSYIISGGRIILRAFKNILKLDIFDENFLMTIATAGAFAIGEYPEGAAVMIFYRIGSLFEDMAVNRSRKSIDSLLNIMPDYANILKTDGSTERVNPDSVNVGDIIIIKPGERVPLDGRIIAGTSSLDAKTITGEALPIEVRTGDEVLSGCINNSGVLKIEVTKPYSDSTVIRILELVTNASEKKAPCENFIKKFSKYYTPAVVLAAVLLAVIPPIIIEGAVFNEWFRRALIFLVVSCPCALVISIPLSFFGGLGRASSNGILVKGSGYLEALSKAETIVFDKTGTLTKGSFKVRNIHSFGNMSKEELLELCAYAESASNHPIGLAVIKEYGKKIDNSFPIDIEEKGGLGVKAIFKGKTILAGNLKLMRDNNIDFNEQRTDSTILYIAIDSKPEGFIEIADVIKSDARSAISELKSLGVKKIAMFSGDNITVSKKIGEELQIDDVRAQLLPHQKVAELENITKLGKGKVIFVGDGINDSPVLARSDIGIAMSGIGSDAAVEAADIILMTDEPSKIPLGIKISRKTLKIVKQNIFIALFVKFSILILSTFGIAQMWAAVFADVGVTIIAVFNSLRVLKGKIR